MTKFMARPIRSTSTTPQGSPPDSHQPTLTTCTLPMLINTQQRINSHIAMARAQMARLQAVALALKAPEKLVRRRQRRPTRAK